MDIFKCLQGLRPFRSHRLVLFSFAASVAATVFAAGWISKTSSEPIAPSLKEQSWSCSKENKVIISSPSSRISLPLQLTQTTDNLAFVDLDVQGTLWKIAALTTDSVGDFMAELLKKAPCPMIAVVRDEQEAEYLIVYGKDRRLSLSSIKHIIEQDLFEQKNEKFIRVLLSNVHTESPSEVRILAR